MRRGLHAGQVCLAIPVCHRPIDHSASSLAISLESMGAQLLRELTAFLEPGGKLLVNIPHPRWQVGATFVALAEKPSEPRHASIHWLNESSGTRFTT